MGSLLRWGVWKRSGMGGMITGLDMTEAMAGIPPDCNQAFARRLFSIAEAAFCAANIRDAINKGSK